MWICQNTLDFIGDSGSVAEMMTDRTCYAGDTIRHDSYPDQMVYVGLLGDSVVSIRQRGGDVAGAEFAMSSDGWRFWHTGERVERFH